MAAKKTATRKTAVEQPAVQRPVAKKPAAKKPAVETVGAKKPAAPKKPTAKAKLSPEARYLAIQEAAYYIAEQSHFQRDRQECWLEAEKQIADKYGK